MITQDDALIIMSLLDDAQREAGGLDDHEQQLRQHVFETFPAVRQMVLDDEFRRHVWAYVAHENRAITGIYESEQRIFMHCLDGFRP